MVASVPARRAAAGRPGRPRMLTTRRSAIPWGALPTPPGAWATAGATPSAAPTPPRHPVPPGRDPVRRASRPPGPLRPALMPTSTGDQPPSWPTQRLSGALRRSDQARSALIPARAPPMSPHGRPAVGCQSARQRRAQTRQGPAPIHPTPAQFPPAPLRARTSTR